MRDTSLIFKLVFSRLNGILLFIAGSALCLNCDSVGSNSFAHSLAFFVGSWVALGGASLFVINRG